jgi:hypothetical protein
VGRPAVLKVDIVADAKGVGKGVDDADRHFGRLGDSAKKVGAVIGAGLAVGAVAAGAFAVSAVKSASDVQQSYGALESVFGKNAAQVKSWADNASAAVGLSKNEYASLADVVGAQLTGMGKSTADAAGQTNNLVKMGADLAATFGGSVSDAVSAVGSLLKGEMDPIEKYGVSIKQSDVNARLAAEGHDKLTGAALKTATANATLTLLTEKTAAAHGAFSRESDTLAHQQQVLGAQFENVKASVGEKLLPVLTTLATYVSTSLLPNAQALWNHLATQLGPTFTKVGAFVTDNVVPALSKLGDYARTHLLPALAQLATFIGTNVVPVFTRWAGFILDNVVPAVLKIAGPVLDGFRSALKTIGAAIDDNRDNLDKIGDALEAVGKVVLKVAPYVGTTLKIAFEVVGKAIGLVLDIIGGVVGALDTVIGKVQWVLDKGSAVSGIVGKLNPFGGPPLAVSGPQLVGVVDQLGPRSQQLVGAAFGDGPSGLASVGGRAAGGLVVIDARTIDQSIRVDGALDADSVARQLADLLRDRDVRLGAVPMLGGVAAA